MYLKRVTSIFSIIMIFMFTIGQSLLPIVANAQELNTLGLVDSFTIGKTNLQYGEQTKINVNFSEKSGNKMKSGDTLTLTLPPELKGFNGTIPLNDEQGKNFGTCKVTAGNVVCTFNDVVEQVENIKGHFNFTVQATNVATDETKVVETNLGTNLDKQTVTITGPTSGGGTDPGEQSFSDKVGDIQPDNTDEVRWFLRINNNKEKLNSDIIVTDSLQEGQTLNKGSFYIYVNNVTYLSLETFETQGYGKITFVDDKSFKVVINKDKASGNAFSIGYTATITEAGKKLESFKNDYKIEYQVVDKDKVSTTDSATVKNIESGSGIEGDLPSKGMLRIVKHLEGDEEKVIPNVKFKLYKASDEQVGDEYTTDEKGIIEIKGLTPGKYYVQEVSAPNYIDFDPQAKVEFEVKADAVNGIKLPISNKVKTTSIAGMKTWKGDNEKDRPSSIKVELLQNEKVIDTKEVTAADGWKYKFDNLAVYDANGVAYKYEVKEQPIDGYTTEVKGYDITNTKVAQTKVEGTKTWKDDNAKDRPTMIKVDLLQNEKVIDTKEVTAADGWKYKFDNLAVYDANGVVYKYEVKEQAVNGYQTEVKGNDITNTKVGQTKVEGTKVWKDGNGEGRPETIKVDLLQNGQVIDTKEVSAASEWKYAFTDLAAYDAEGKAYKY
ncbi:Cna B-type domain-containing protein, partial [Bacillus mycoides]|uniref:Cna B-type domain-containing protein n=1 Tax=Bacillus mycoides TaxID=1405 RepID=UPI001038D4FC